MRATTAQRRSTYRVNGLFHGAPRRYWYEVLGTPLSYGGTP